MLESTRITFGEFPFLALEKSKPRAIALEGVFRGVRGLCCGLNLTLAAASAHLSFVIFASVEVSKEVTLISEMGRTGVTLLFGESLGETIPGIDNGGGTDKDCADCEEPVPDTILTPSPNG